MDSEDDTFDILEYIGESSAGFVLEEAEDLAIEDFDDFARDLEEEPPSNGEIECTAAEFDYFADKTLKSNSSNSPGSSINPDSGSDFAQEESACPVCHGKLGNKHSYYGGRVCISCRAFFRRAVQSGRYSLFKCKDGRGDCSVDSKSRTSCRFCRFDKCLAAGTKVSLVMSEERRATKTWQRNNLLSREKTRQLRLSIDNAICSFTVEDQTRYQALMKQFFDFTHVSYFNFFAGRIEEYKMLHDMLVEFKPFFGCQYETFYQLDEHLIKNFAFNISEMDVLSPADKMSLIMQNFKVVYGVLYSVAGTHRALIEYMKDFVRFGKQHRDSNPSVNILMTALNLEESLEKALQLNAKSNNKEQRSFNPVQSRNKQYNLYNSMIVKIFSCISDSASDGCDNVLVYLILMTAIFNPGPLVLEKRRVVEDIHNRFVWELHKYLKARFGGKSAFRLHKTLMVLVQASVVHDIHRNKAIVMR